MIRAAQIFSVTILTSFAIFPFFFSFLPGINTKMFLAVFGLLAFGFDYRNGIVTQFTDKFIKLTLWAVGVSFCSLLTMVINDTPDNSYLTFVMSFWVWLFASYCCVYLMRCVHGKISIATISYYLMAVALLQCVAAILMYRIPYLEDLFTHFITGERYMGIGIGTARLHGIGCALDVGGGRIGAILIMIAYLIILNLKQKAQKWKLLGLIMGFFFIMVCGNMMGRTASVGAAIAIVYATYRIITDRQIAEASKISLIKLLSVCLIIGSSLCVLLYNTNDSFYTLFRFGFEGFFNYFEYGKFETHSTDMLSEGMIFPDNLKTWIIGDGYMAGVANDPYYIGPSDYGFYMNTDAGYSRFIFYFGLVGLSSICAFMICTCKECIGKLRYTSFLFLSMLLLNFAIWIKVSTDLFVMFAPFLCLDDESLYESSMVH